MKFFNGGILVFSPICLHVLLFDVEALNDFYFDRTPLILKACKASHSVITVSLVSRFSRNSSIAITRKK